MSDLTEPPLRATSRALRSLLLLVTIVDCPNSATGLGVEPERFGGVHGGSTWICHSTRRPSAKRALVARYIVGVGGVRLGTTAESYLDGLS